jgi:hypothetical protein
MTSPLVPAALTISALVAALLCANACSSSVAPHDVGGTGSGGSAAGTGGSEAGTGPVACAPQGCAADEYCFHPWSCAAGAACSASCPCTCGGLPASCPASSPCNCPGTGAFGGYFGNPGEVFSGPDAGGYADSQVYCYGS